MTNKKFVVILLCGIYWGFGAVGLQSKTALSAELQANTESACGLSAEMLRAHLNAQPEKSEILIIDVRPQPEFEKCRIPGAIHLPLFAIKTKAFLKTKTILLVDAGYRVNELEQACIQLKSVGFNARYLIGGLQAWQVAGGQLECDGLAQTMLNHISAELFWTSRTNEDWLLIDITPGEKSVLQTLIPQTIFLPYEQNTSAFIGKLQKLIRSVRQQAYQPILICNSHGTGYAELEQLLLEAGIQQVFFLQGGIAAYTQVVEQQTRITESKGRTQKTVEQCPCCQQNQTDSL